MSAHSSSRRALSGLAKSSIYTLRGVSNHDRQGIEQGADWERKNALDEIETAIRVRRGSKFNREGKGAWTKKEFGIILMESASGLQ